MQIQENISLKPYNTFGIDVTSKYFARFQNLDSAQDLLSFIKRKNIDSLIIGGGSNILLTQPYNGLVMKNEIAGIEIVEETAGHVLVKCGAGENWHRFVMFCVNNNLSGVENLSLIPGSVGASPMQNIGAYGVEIKDVFENLEAYHVREEKTYSFSKDECEFGYRESVFKKKLRNQFIILNVTFRLRKDPVFNTSYGPIRDELERMEVNDLSIAAISQAVINIRRSKLPNPDEIGNAGSFFKNPTISIQHFQQLKDKHPGIVGYQVDNEKVKVAAGWLIEQAGWKGYRNGDAGVHRKQALVLVNYGTAKGEEILLLAQKITESVEELYNIPLEREVNVV